MVSKGKRKLKVSRALDAKLKEKARQDEEKLKIIDYENTVDRNQRDKKARAEALCAAERAKAHLLDYRLRLESENMKAMAAEIRCTVDGLDNTIMYLGGSIAYKVAIKPDGHLEWRKE